MLVIGDVHGKLDLYIDKVIDHEGPTLQLGDMGFNYDALSVLDPHQHKFFGGNHDNYDKYDDCPHSLGDFGIWNNVFYMRGAWSIDQAYRTEGESWWRREELNYTESLECLSVYATVKPNVVITHECPQFLGDDLFHYQPNISTHTGLLLQQMYDEHQPERWLFGHHHKDASIYRGPTLFQCLGELTTTEV